jgi:glycosyltransferase involved in cell wall biosynthesis
MEPLISVIIPAYNIEHYIERSLQSVCGQTYKNLEIIVVNDGSSDKTGEIIDRMATTDSRIIPVHKQNAGVSAARNTGLDIAKGDYIGFTIENKFVIGYGLDDEQNYRNLNYIGYVKE